MLSTVTLRGKKHLKIATKKAEPTKTIRIYGGYVSVFLAEVTELSLFYR